MLILIHLPNQDLSGGNICFDHMALIVTFDLLSKNFNMAPNFLP